MRAPGPRQRSPSAHALEADAVLAGDEKGVVAGVTPGLSLHMTCVWVGDVGPPLLTRRALGKHGAEDALDLGEAQFEFVLTLATQMSAERVVCGRPPPCKMTENII